MIISIQSFICTVEKILGEGRIFVKKISGEGSFYPDLFVYIVVFQYLCFTKDMAKEEQVLYVLVYMTVFL